LLKCAPPLHPQAEATAAANAVVEAAGPATVAFSQGASAGQFVGTLEAAGAYLLHVRLGASPLAGWPRVLHVLPAAADPARCPLSPGSPGVLKTDVPAVKNSVQGAPVDRGPWMQPLSLNFETG